MSKDNKEIYLIDGNSLCYRAYYAIPELSTSKGEPTNAILGFVNMLRKLINEHQPGMLTIVFDSKGPTARHERYEDYKVHRKPMPDDLVGQLPRIKELISALGISSCELSGYEADDIIATLAEKARKKGVKVTIVTSDKDALQLVDKDVKVLSPHTNSEKLYQEKEVRDKYGVSPENMVELMALTGDASDNIPGVKGVGQVTAGKLIREYGDVKSLYKNVKKITSESLKNKLIEGKEMALLSRELVELDKKVPVKLDLKKAVIGEPDIKKLVKLYKEFEFQKLLREVMPEEEKEVAYSSVSAGNNARDAAAALKKSKMAAMTVERSGPGDKPSGIALSTREGEAAFFDLKDKDILKELKPILEDPKVTKAGYDIKEDIRALRGLGVDLKGADFDVMIADYLIDPSRSDYSLEGMVMRLLGYNLSAGAGVKWDEKGQGSMDLSEAESDPGLSCERSDAVFRLYGGLEPELNKKKLDKLFREVEMPLVEVLADMEDEGVGVDVAYLRARSGDLGERLEELTGKIYGMAGEEFNINSPKQLQVILYDKLGLPVTKRTKTGASTDESVLRKLAEEHELPGALLEYRELNKLKTAYYDSIVELVDKTSGKLHARFNQAVTATGRLSSSEPNLQNIPIKTELGSQIRRAFVPGEKGKKLLAADYSQIELRILAHLSGDEQLVKAFELGQDVHSITASLIFDRGAGEVTDRMRSVAKTVNFGIVYGMSPFGLAKDLGISVDEAYKFIGSYFKRYSGVSSFIDSTIENARKKGYVTTLLNRRRYIPEIKSSNERVKGFAERVAVNTPVQGSAADLIKLAMIACQREFKGSGTSMIIQVHDELVFKVPARSVKSAAARVKEIMENVMSLKVPLKVDMESGDNWLDMEPVEV